MEKSKAIASLFTHSVSVLCRGFFGLSAPWHKFVDAIDLVIGSALALADRCEPCLGVDAVQLAGFHERVGDFSGLPAPDRPHE